jgi:hypothetical protein
LYQAKIDIDVWDETRIGSDEIKLPDALAYARVAVLLVTADYLASDIIMQAQLPLVLDAAKQGELRVVWIAITPTRWSTTPLANFQAANDPTQPLNHMKDWERDRELARITGMIAQTVGERPPYSV